MSSSCSFSVFLILFKYLSRGSAFGPHTIILNIRNDSASERCGAFYPEAKMVMSILQLAGLWSWLVHIVLVSIDIDICISPIVQ